MSNQNFVVVYNDGHFESFASNEAAEAAVDDYNDNLEPGETRAIILHR